MFEKYAESFAIFCRVYNGCQRDLPLRSSEMGVLIYIAKAGSEVISKDIADYFGISKPAVAVTIKKLEKEGYIYKKDIPEDKRKSILCPTPKGMKTVTETYDEFHKTVEFLYNRMGKEELEDLTALLNKASSILIEKRKSDV